MEARASNPDHGLHEMLKNLYRPGASTRTESRNGATIRFNEPFTLVWENPRHRVSFCEVRDANPAFHLFEAFWMIAGHRDVKRPSHFASGMKAFSDDGQNFEGAYGYRWRTHFGTDQIDDYIIPSLKVKKEDRRCVLAMWDGDLDIKNGTQGGKDLCCNLDATFDAAFGELNMTVFNRSNDMVFGAAGANVVHFSMLQEYIAGALGIPVGKYFQISSNMHLYLGLSEAHKKVLQKFKDVWDGERVDTSRDYHGIVLPLFDPSADPELKKIVIDKDIATLMENYDDVNWDFETKFFRKVVGPVIGAYNLYKRDHLEQALQLLSDCIKTDWQIATCAWIQRRIDSRNAKIHEKTVDASEETWVKTLKAVWPSATPVKTSINGKDVLAFEAEVWNGKEMVLENVGMRVDSGVTIRERGTKQ